MSNIRPRTRADGGGQKAPDRHDNDADNIRQEVTVGHFDRRELMSREKPDDPYADRKALTFEQAEGIVPLPTQLLPKEVSQELSALLWAVVHANLNTTGGRHILR